MVLDPTAKTGEIFRARRRPVRRACQSSYRDIFDVKTKLPDGILGLGLHSKHIVAYHIGSTELSEVASFRERSGGPRILGTTQRLKYQKSLE